MVSRPPEVNWALPDKRLTATQGTPASGPECWAKLWFTCHGAGSDCWRRRLGRGSIWTLDEMEATNMRRIIGGFCRAV